MDLTRRQFLFFSLSALAGLGFGYLGRGRISRERDMLRPPGARAEADFLATCIRCGLCVEACPYDTLHLASLAAGAAAGTPYFIARQGPCYLCQGYESLRCIDVCPTGALQPVPTWADVRIGVAVLDRETCLAWTGTVCRACWHACPFPSEAIYLDHVGRAIVVEDKCVGCGLCEHACLVDPPAIVIVPHAT